MNTRKKLLIGGGIACAVIAGGSVTAWVYANSNSPEKILYAAMAEETTDTLYAKEESQGDSTTKLSAIAMGKRNGDTKLEATFACSAKSDDMGDLQMDTTMRQVNEKVFMRYDKIAISNSDDAEMETMANEYFQEMMAGKWIAMANPDPTYMGYKEKGVRFSILGAESKKMSAADTAQKFRDHNVMTINSTRTVDVDGKDAIEYTLSVRRSAYEKFMDAVAPGFPYKTDILNNLFDNDNEEVTVVIDKKTKAVILFEYGMSNPCVDMINGVDPTMTSDLPEVVRIKNTTVSRNKADAITVPADAISEADFYAALEVEEE